MKKPAKAAKKTPAANAALIKLIDQRIALSREPATEVPAARSTLAVRFVKIGADDKPLPDSAKKWDWVYDRQQQLLIAAEIIEGDFTFDGANAAATKLHPQARSLELQELVSVLDYTRHGPAVDTTFFRWKARSVWTGTKTAWNPSGYAWAVGLDSGNAYYWSQSSRSCALACRPGQYLGL